MAANARKGWSERFRQKSHIKRQRPERTKKRKLNREDARRFFYNTRSTEPSKATKPSHGTKKVKNRARNKRAKAARKVNR